MNFKFDCPAIFLIGPTACGKTDQAISIAQKFPIEIISVDSAMVYKGMDIGTAKPSKDVRKLVPHHLVDIISPEQSFDLGLFLNEAKKAIEIIRERNKFPLFVGGSMLFHKTLLEGIHDFPNDENIRKNIQSLRESKGFERLVEELKNSDIETYKAIDIKNPRRLERALEIIRITGKKLSLLKTEPKTIFFNKKKCLLLGLTEEKKVLEDLAKKRLLKMINDGFMDELENLRKAYKLNSKMQSMNTINYKQFMPYIDGDISLENSIDDALDATKQLIKTQLNWMKKFELNYCANTGNINDSETFSDTIKTYLRSYIK